MTPAPSRPVRAVRRREPRGPCRRRRAASGAERFGGLRSGPGLATEDAESAGTGRPLPSFPDASGGDRLQDAVPGAITCDFEDLHGAGLHCPKSMVLQRRCDRIGRFGGRFRFPAASHATSTRTGAESSSRRGARVSVDGETTRRVDEIRFGCSGGCEITTSRSTPFVAGGCSGEWPEAAGAGSRIQG